MLISCLINYFNDNFHNFGFGQPEKYFFSKLNSIRSILQPKNKLLRFVELVLQDNMVKSDKVYCSIG